MISLKDSAEERPGIWEKLGEYSFHAALAVLVLAVLGVSYWIWRARYDECRQQFSAFYCATQK